LLVITFSSIGTLLYLYIFSFYYYIKSSFWDGFVDNLVEVTQKKEYFYNFESKNKKFKYSDELENGIKKYNQILGGIAFVRYTTEGEYSKNYFSIISHFNKKIKENYKKINKDIYTKYNGAFTYEGNHWSKLAPLCYKQISEEDVKKYAKEEGLNIKKSNGVFQYQLLDNKTSITYKLAILNTYGEDSTKRKTTNDLIYSFKNEKIPVDKVEGISLIFGINSGYSSFRNKYDNKIVKFKMDSLLDYYVIESIFQYAINNKKENEGFNYIDNIFPTKELQLGTKIDNINQIKEENYIKCFKCNEKDEKIKKLENENLELKNELEKLKTKNKIAQSFEGNRVYTEQDLRKLKVPDLKNIAKSKNMKKYSKLRKNELIELILNTQKERLLW